MPKYGPIEYAIFELTEKLADMETPEWTLADLDHNTHEDSARIGPFNNTFEICGL